MLLKLDPNYKCQNGCFQNGKNPTDFNLNKILNRAGSKKSACHKAAPHECTLLAGHCPSPILLLTDSCRATFSHTISVSLFGTS